MANDSKETSKPETTVKRPFQNADVVAVRENTKRELDKQPKRHIRLRKSENPKAPIYETVQINGYTYMILKGEDVEVPDEVYNILVRSGLY